MTLVVFSLGRCETLNVHSKTHPFKGKMGVLKFEDAHQNHHAKVQLVLLRHALVPQHHHNGDVVQW